MANGSTNSIPINRGNNVKWEMNGAYGRTNGNKRFDVGFRVYGMDCNVSM